MKGNTQLKISKMQPSDIGDICYIQDECGLSLWKATDYLMELTRKDSIVLVAKRNKRITGFLLSRFSTMTPIRDTNYTTTELEAELLNFGVLKEFQKQGIGNSLFNKFLQTAYAIEARTIWLEVRASNQTAAKFYKNRDFTEMQRRKNFYTNPSEDAIIMRCDLSETALPVQTKLDSAQDFDITSIS